MLKIIKEIEKIKNNINQLIGAICGMQKILKKINNFSLTN